MRKDRLFIKGKPTGTAKDEIVLQHMINKHSGKPIPYFIDENDGRLKYLDKKTTDKKTGVVNYGYVDLTKKLEREARYQADKLKLTPDLKRFQKAFGKVKGQQIFLDELAKNDAIFTANNPDLFDIDHMGSKKFKYPHMARNFNPQLSAANRAEGARLLTKEQETALRILRDDLDTTIKLQGPELTQVQKDQVLGRDKGGTTKDLIKNELKINGNGSNGENGALKNGAKDYADKLLISKAGKGSKTLGRIGRVLLPSALGAGAAVLSGMDVKAREAKANGTRKWIDKLQHNIAKTELATDIAGAIPGPQSLITEPVNLAAGLSNLFIDGVRGFKPNGKTSLKDRKRAVDSLKFIK